MLLPSKGLPLMVQTTPANVRDELPLMEMIRTLPAIKGPRGRPRRKPKALMGDRGYGFPWIIAVVLAMGITSLLAPRGSGHGNGLGKRRYVVEQTLAAYGNFRRIKLCYERTGAHFQAFHDLASCLLCANRLRYVTGGLCNSFLAILAVTMPKNGPFLTNFGQLDPLRASYV